MRKIPTLFRRNPDDMRHVLPEVTLGCEWVLDGEGTPTRKYDGTCVLIRRDGMAVHAWTRREVKPGKTRPPGFMEIETDPVTGKTVGWEPASQSGFAKFVDEAIHPGLVPGTYELVGPKVNGNPEGYDTHTLIEHASADVMILPAELSFEVFAEIMPLLHHEGIVWHHPDGRMAKLKRRDFT